jgi:hypothetical protein
MDDELKNGKFPTLSNKISFSWKIPNQNPEIYL